MNETTAISLCMKSRDPRGFEYLVKQYRREAYFHALGFLGEPAAAEDICQESFAKAFAYFPRLKSMNAFYPWFYTILKNNCLDYIRSRKSLEPLDEAEAIIEDVAGDPQRSIEGADEKRAVWVALQRLKPEFREILILKHLRDTSYADISAILQIPRGTVMSRLYHARRAFQHTYTQTTTGESTP